MEHAFHIRNHGNGFLAKTYDNAQKSIRKVWTLKKLIIQGGAFKLGRAVKHDSRFPWFLRMENWMVG